MKNNPCTHKTLAAGLGNPSTLHRDTVITFLCYYCVTKSHTSLSILCLNIIISTAK